MFLVALFVMPNERDVLMPYTSFVIWIPYLIAANTVSEGNAEKVLVTEVIMHFTAIAPANANVNLPFHKIGKECLMCQGTILYISHLDCILPRRWRIPTRVYNIIVGV